MVEYVPALRIRAESTSISADFHGFAEAALSLGELVDGFVNAALVEGVFSHSCSSLREGGKVRLFGGEVSAAEAFGAREWETLRFPVTGWDEERYEVEMIVPAGHIGDDRKACLHAMAVLYVCRGVALLEVDDDLCDDRLTPRERHCLNEAGQGSSFLDIAEELGCSVHAVKVHLQRARAKVA